METQKNEMTTLSSVLEKLRLKKRDNEFRMYPEGFGTTPDKHYQPEDLKILRTYRFEGDSDPSDNVILYILEANDGQVGYNMDAYGAYSNHEGDGYDEFIKKIPMEDREEADIFG